MANRKPTERKKQAARAVWDVAHGVTAPAVAEALRLGGKVRRVVPRSPAPSPGNGGGGWREATAPAPAAGDDCLAAVRRAVDGERVAEAKALEVMGERRQAREVRELLFVAALAAWLECAGAVPAADVVNGLALLLGVSPATTKRYLRAHASPFGEFALDGDFVRVRR